LSWKISRTISVHTDPSGVYGGNSLGDFRLVMDS